MFNRFDPNGNGYLSLAEVDKGVSILRCYYKHDAVLWSIRCGVSGPLCYNIVLARRPKAYY